jgi:ketosteroid isomerase-like protein
MGILPHLESHDETYVALARALKSRDHARRSEAEINLRSHARNQPKNKRSEQNGNRSNGNNREMTKGKITRTNDIVAIARPAYEAYVAKNRAAIEKLIAADFHFTSPLDNRIDRETYFAHCWPNSERIDGFNFINLVRDGDRVFVTYEGHAGNGERFRNTEIVTVRDGQIVEVEVYFGWSIPHKAKPGRFVEDHED